jgi:UDP:flavonoid glycosyltransferase YjiC (YdhE family)
MSRILLTWELGLNFGHLARLLPIAERLKADGHTIMAAARDLHAAAMVLGPAGIPFVQAPHLTKGIPLAYRATGYADILLSQGWSDRSALWGLTQGWLNLIGMFRPDQMILDYSPTVTLAARIARVPCVLVGNGFELPPLTDPLPAFPGFSWANAEKAFEAEGLAINQANDVLGTHQTPPIGALRDLMSGHTRFLATFPDLDHYGERADARYIGPLLGKIGGRKVAWPKGEGPKIFACLRPDTANVKEILVALKSIRARVICVASGFSAAQLVGRCAGDVVVSLGPVELDPLLDADLCLTYGAEGTIFRFLLAGVRQLVAPWHVETYLAARQLEKVGVGTSLPTAATSRDIANAINERISDGEALQRTRDFRGRCATLLARNGADILAARVGGDRWGPAENQGTQPTARIPASDGRQLAR